MTGRGRRRWALERRLRRSERAAVQVEVDALGRVLLALVPLGFDARRRVLR